MCGREAVCPRTLLGFTGALAMLVSTHIGYEAYRLAVCHIEACFPWWGVVYIPHTPIWVLYADQPPGAP